MDAQVVEPHVQWCYETEGGRSAFALNVSGDVAKDTSLIPAILRELL